MPQKIILITWSKVILMIDRVEMIVYALLAGVIFMIIGLLRILKGRNLTKIGISVKGKVVRIVSGKGNARVFYPIVQFLTEQGKSFEEMSSFGTYPSLYKKGDMVDIMYDPVKPVQFVILSKKGDLIAWLCIFLGATIILPCLFLIVFSYLI
ncbi:MAG: DUF3592 domain-containing protein [Flavobacteriales bacterium]|nr:MAG: DUF3592 domain-containing protein [Flavobacteriales bacterium]